MKNPRCRVGLAVKQPAAKQTRRSGFRFKSSLASVLVVLLAGLAPRHAAAATTPCAGAQRWTEGGQWNPDGTVNDKPNTAPKGIIRCGSAADTQSGIIPLYGSTYSPSAFPIEVFRYGGVWLFGKTPEHPKAQKPCQDATRMFFRSRNSACLPLFHCFTGRRYPTTRE